jgi:hypothetical protein
MGARPFADSFGIVLWTEPLLPIDADPPAAVDASRAWVVARPSLDGSWHWSATDSRSDHDQLAVQASPAPSRALGVAMRFAEHLFTLRQERNLIPGAVILAGIRPARIPKHVLIPHLATVIDRTGRTGDHVVWEQLPDEKIVDWLGGAPEPDWAWLIGSLERLMALRARVRCGQLDETADHRELAELIGNRFLSIRVVCRNATLFGRLLSV